jgi:hypothetical protein
VALGVTAADALALSALVRGLAKQDKVAGGLQQLAALVLHCRMTA